ncbi:MAG: MliC family protein [Pseudomonadota bacterium]
MRPLALLAVLALAACSDDDPSAAQERAYACEGGTAFSAVFNPVSKIATVLGLGPVGILLPEQPTESGFLYATERVSLAGEGETAVITVDGASLTCRTVSGGVTAGQ